MLPTIVVSCGIMGVGTTLFSNYYQNLDIGVRTFHIPIYPFISLRAFGEDFVSTGTTHPPPSNAFGCILTCCIIRDTDR